MYEIGLSTCGKINFEELFSKYKNAGMTAAEISPNSEDYMKIDYKELLTIAQKYGIKLWSYHLPYYPFDEVDIANKNLCKKTVEYFSELIKRASDIGIDKFVVHPSGSPVLENERYEKKETAKESLFELADIAGKNGAAIAVENLTSHCIGRNSDEILELTDVDSRLRVCFDTNHLFGENLSDFIQKIGDRLLTIHVSDYDFAEERHWLPGEGKVDWQEVVSALQGVGFCGIWMYEIGFACPKTISRSRNLACEDFVRNAKEILSGEKPTIIV